MSDKKYDEIEYSDETYRRMKQGWVDSHFMIAPAVIQSKLNHLFAEKLDTSDMNVEELISEGDQFRDSGAVVKSIELYLQALDIADVNQTRLILSKLSSSYRKQGNPGKSIELYEEYKGNYFCLSSAFFTSVAAAYCDIEDYDNAMYCAKRAQASSGGIVSGELAGVYGRIRSLTGEKLEDDI